MRDPDIGDILDGRYRIDAHIGSGGMGIVYKCHHLLLERSVAIKVIRPAAAGSEDEVQATFRKRFFREAQLASRLIHRNIVQTREFGETPDGGFYMVMDFIEGRPLSEIIDREAPLEIPRALGIISQVLDAMIEAHSQGIIHRDLKPANIIVEAGDKVRVLDFGIAKLRDPDPESPQPSDKLHVLNTPLTIEGDMIGTPRYMAPEQATDATTCDGRTDLYAIGLLLSELLTGAQPFFQTHGQRLIMERLTADPRPLSELNPNVHLPQRLEDALLKVLARKPEARWPNAEAFKEALLASVDKPAPPEPAPGADPSAGPPWRRPLALAIATLVLAALGIGLQVWISEKARPSTAELQKIALETFGQLPHSVPSTPGEALSPAQVELGRMLFHDARLSSSKRISCHTCHDLTKYGVDGAERSRSATGALSPRNTPSVYNAALHTFQRWDGTVSPLEKQCGLPLLSPDEHDMESKQSVERVLLGIPGYGAHFSEAFPDDPKPIRFENVTLALGAFLRTLTTPARFDDFIAGDLDALSPQELDGLWDFIQVGCTTCHVDPSVGGTKTQKLGLINPFDAKDLGQYTVTGQSQHRYVFKVASLRNVTQTSPYLHDGSISSLREMVRLMAYHQLDRTLSEGEADNIVAFLDALTGRIDPRHTARPRLP